MRTGRGTHWFAYLRTFGFCSVFVFFVWVWLVAHQGGSTELAVANHPVYLVPTELPCCHWVGFVTIDLAKLPGF